MPKTVLYFDCFSGLAGDMTLGALIDLGIEVDELESALRTLPLDHWELDVKRRVQNGLMGTDVHVWVNGEKEEPAGTTDDGQGSAGHGHESIEASHLSTQHDPTNHHHAGHRHYHEIVKIIEGGQLPEPVVEQALKAFEILGEAEARVHGVPLSDVHFHEVGAVDSIIDIVGVAWCIWRLGVDHIECAPLPMGRGFIRCAHGRMPLPAPATLDILKGIPVIDAGLERELVTPTGAAFIKAWASRVGPLPAMTVRTVGWGHGDAVFPDRPNMLRLILGDIDTSAESVFMLEANIDDMTPELLGHLMERLLEVGALDAWFSPIHMKKNRPGCMVSALVDAHSLETVRAVILTESTSIGVRQYPVSRDTLTRRTVDVSLPWGMVRVKVAFQGSVVLNVAPEFEDCRSLAQRSGHPLKRIFQEAIAAYYRDL